VNSFLYLMFQLLPILFMALKFLQLHCHVWKIFTLISSLRCLIELSFYIKHVMLLVCCFNSASLANIGCECSGGVCNYANCYNNCWPR